MNNSDACGELFTSSYTKGHSVLMPLAACCLPPFLGGSVWPRTGYLHGHLTRMCLSHRGLDHSQCLLSTCLNSTWKFTNILEVIYSNHKPALTDENPKVCFFIHIEIWHKYTPRLFFHVKCGKEVNSEYGRDWEARKIEKLNVVIGKTICRSW